VRLQVGTNSVWLCALITVVVISLAVGCVSSSHPGLSVFLCASRPDISIFTTSETPRRLKLWHVLPMATSTLSIGTFSSQISNTHSGFRVREPEPFRELCPTRVARARPGRGSAFICIPTNLLATYEDSGLGTFYSRNLSCVCGKRLEKPPSLGRRGPSQPFFESFTAIGRTTNSSCSGVFRIPGAYERWEII